MDMPFMAALKLLGSGGGGGTGTPGASIDHMEVNGDGELLVVYDNGKVDNLGKIPITGALDLNYVTTDSEVNEMLEEVFGT